MLALGVTSKTILDVVGEGVLGIGVVFVSNGNLGNSWGGYEGLSRGSIGQGSGMCYDGGSCVGSIGGYWGVGSIGGHWGVAVGNGLGRKESSTGHGDESAEGQELQKRCRELVVALE